MLSIHSLEPLRPWKVEQLGNGYHLSSWMERTAMEHADSIIAVSEQTREDVLRLFDVPSGRVHVIHNGIDPEEYRPTGRTSALERHGIDPTRPYLLFVGRITRQKGIIHLVDAIPQIDPGLPVVLAAGAPDTPEIGREMEARVAAVQAERPGVLRVPPQNGLLNLVVDGRAVPRPVGNRSGVFLGDSGRAELAADTIDAAVQENSRNAAQNTPVIRSARLVPMVGEVGPFGAAASVSSGPVIHGPFGNAQ